MLIFFKLVPPLAKCRDKAYKFYYTGPTEEHDFPILRETLQPTITG